MYPYNSCYIEDWKKKIIYAPNGFGKTTNSRMMADELEKKGRKVKLFTHKNLEELIDEFDNEFFVGITAKQQTEKMRIEKAVGQIKPLVDGVEAKSFTAAIKDSFALKFYNVKKATDFPKLIDKDITKIREKYRDYNDETLSKLDILLDYSLFRDIELFMSRYKTYDELEKDELNDLYVSKEVKENVFSLLLYCKLNHFKTCILCGKKYKNYNSLLKHIEEHYSELKLIEGESASREINALVERLILFINSVDNPIIKKVFEGLSFKTNRKKFIALKLYNQLSMDDVYLISNKIGEQIVPGEGDNIFNCFAQINKLDKKIKEIDGDSDKDFSKIDKFNSFVIKEIESIIPHDENMKIVPHKGKKGFYFKIDNKKQNAYDFLSTSEFKRFILVILYAEIKFSDVNTLILDDPIDSYDDYTKILAIKYISKILKLKKLENWYILTNDFECVYNLSSIQKCNTLFYLADPDYVFNGVTYNYWSQECTFNEVKIIGKNDLYFLVDFISKTKRKYHYDNDLMLCALSLPLRNINSEMIKTLKYVGVVNSKGLIDNSWNNKVDGMIVSCFEHYRSNNYQLGIAMERSNSLQISKVAKLYVEMHHSTKNTPCSYTADSRLIVPFREAVTKRSFASFRTGKFSDIVNYLFLKAVMIETIKYEFEKKVVEKGYASFKKADMDSKLSKSCGLQSIINSISSLHKITHVYGVDSFVKRCQQIHEEHSVMYNAIDHATTMMISPYLSISLRDIKAFKDKVNSL